MADRSSSSEHLNPYCSSQLGPSAARRRVLIHQHCQSECKLTWQDNLKKVNLDTLASELYMLLS
jgi:hypothetical protein